MVSNRRVLFLYKLEINRIERIYRFKRGTAISLFTGGYNAFKSYSLIPPERYRIQKYENIINLCFILRIY